MQNHEIVADRPRLTSLPARDDTVKLTALLALVVFGPSALRYEFALSSFAPGVALVAAAVWTASALGLFEQPRGAAGHVVVVAICCVLIAVHIMLTNLLGEPELQRPLFSLALLAGLLAAAHYVGRVFFGSGHNPHRAAQIVLLLFALIALLSLAGFAPSTEFRLVRPVYPFTEPSHYALTVMPFLIYAVVTSNGLVRLAILGMTAVVVILLQSLSLAVGLMLAAACCLNGVALAGSLAVALAGLSMIDLTYFNDRLDFSYANENLSMLVYRQGVELAVKSMETTAGWGVGFQRLGFTNLFTPSSNLIYTLVGNDLNLRDGGFTASKAISEFGVAGLVLVLVYLAKMGWSVLLLRKLANGRDALPAQTIFALACFVGFGIEMFVRGAGYFTPTALLAVAAIPHISPRNVEAMRHDPV